MIDTPFVDSRIRLRNSSDGNTHEQFRMFLEWPIKIKVLQTNIVISILSKTHAASILLHNSARQWRMVGCFSERLKRRISSQLFSRTNESIEVFGPLSPVLPWSIDILPRQKMVTKKVSVSVSTRFIHSLTKITRHSLLAAARPCEWWLQRQYYKTPKSCHPPAVFPNESIESDPPESLLFPARIAWRQELGSLARN